MILFLQLCSLAQDAGVAGPDSYTQRLDLGLQQQNIRRMALFGARIQLGQIDNSCRHLIYQDLRADLLVVDNDTVRVDGYSQSHARTRNEGPGVVLSADVDLQLEQQSTTWNFARASRIGPAPFRRARGELRLGLMDDNLPSDHLDGFGIQLTGQLEALRYFNDSRARGPGFDRYQLGLRLPWTFHSPEGVGELLALEVNMGQYRSLRADLPTFSYWTFEGLGMQNVIQAGPDHDDPIMGGGFKFASQFLQRDGQTVGALIPVALLLDLYLRWPGSFALLLDIDLGTPFPDPATRLWAQRFEAHLRARWTPGLFHFEFGTLAGLTRSQADGASEEHIWRQRLGLHGEIGARFFENFELLAFYEREFLPASYWANPDGAPGQMEWQQIGLKLRILEARRDHDVDRNMPLIKD